MSGPISRVELVIEVVAWDWPSDGRAEVISVCDGPQAPASVSEALTMLDRALGVLTAADAGSLPVVVQAEVLRALGRAEARETAAGWPVI